MDQLPAAATPGSLPAALLHRPNLLVGDSAYLAKLQAQGALTEAQWQALDTYCRENAAAPVQPSIICKDTDCPYFESCILTREGIPRPVGDPCVIEETVKRNWASLYYAEIGVADDGYAAIDRGVVIDLINTMLDIKRAQDELASGKNGHSSVVATRVIKGWDKDDNPIVDLTVNPVHAYLKHARVVKTKLLESMVATRESRAKNRHQQTTTAASLMTELTEVIRNLTQVPKVEESVTEAEFSLPESDSDSDADSETETVPECDPNYIPEDVG